MPDFVQDEIFKTILWRTMSKGDKTTRQATRQATRQVTRQVTRQAGHQPNEDSMGEVAEVIKRVVQVLHNELKRAEIQELLGLKDRENFVLNYLTPSLESDYIEMTIPESPTHKDQRYRLTLKGMELKKKLQKSKKKK